MEAQYSVNTSAGRSLPWWLPFVIGAALVVQFAGLGGWQINRGLEKRAEQELFSDEAGFSDWQSGMDVRSYQRLSASGTPDSERQFLLENIILNSRIGYYVITPFDPGKNEPLLLVNRGWIEKTSDDFDAAAIALGTESTTVRGRVGSLPRAGYKMGDAITSTSAWPIRAVYPALEDIEAALGQTVQPFVLLLDPQDELGFLRHWVPEEMGPGRHFAYALQWFAMAFVLAALLVWNFRKRKARRE